MNKHYATFTVGGPNSKLHYLVYRWTTPNGYLKIEIGTGISFSFYDAETDTIFELDSYRWHTMFDKLFPEVNVLYPDPRKILEYYKNKILEIPVYEFNPLNDDT